MVAGTRESSQCVHVERLMREQGATQRTERAAKCISQELDNIELIRADRLSEL